MFNRETYPVNKMPLFLEIPHFSSKIYQQMANENDGLGFMNFKMII
jgi:hypothetical protein